MRLRPARVGSLVALTEDQGPGGSLVATTRNLATASYLSAHCSLCGPADGWTNVQHRGSVPQPATGGRGCALHTWHKRHLLPEGTQPGREDTCEERFREAECVRASTPGDSRQPRLGRPRQEPQRAIGWQESPCVGGGRWAAHAVGATSV